MANEDKNFIPLKSRTPEEQHAFHSAGGKAKARKIKERKTIAAALKAVLDEPIQKGSRQTKLDGISIKAIKKMFDDPDIRDLKILAEILGELKQTIEAKGMTLNITSSDEGRSNIEKILEGE